MTSLICILRAVMRGHVVAVMSTRGARFTLARWQDVGCIIQVGARGTAIRSFDNIADLVYDMRARGEKWDAAIIDDPREESRFLEGMDAAAVLIDPPSYIKLAA